MNNDFPREKKFFLLLELLDPTINDLLFRLRHEFTKGSLSSDIHVTIRGPYRKKITPDTITKLGQVLDSDPILIQGIGMFENTDEYVVYIKASADRLTEVCWKPDFPKRTYGCIPHITLYRGDDKELAEKVLDFLNKEPIKLICRNFKLTSYTSKQPELFTLNRKTFEQNLHLSPNEYQVKPDIILRAANLVRSHY